MNHQMLGLIIGGIVPAIAFSITNISAKASSNAGIGIGWYVLLAGIALSLVGACILIFTKERDINFTSGLYALLAGATWGVGMMSIMIALSTYSMSISILTPLFNMNTLVAVLAGLWLFAEWKHVHVPQLLIGSLFIIIGGTLVARS